MSNQVEGQSVSPNDAKPVLTAVKDIHIGSRIELESGEVVKINSITKGWLHNSSFLNYSNGQWSCLLNSDRVALYGS